MSQVYRPTRQTDFARFPESAPIVIDNGASTFRVGYEPPLTPLRRPRELPETLTLTRRFSAPCAQVGWRGGAALLLPQHRAAAAPPRHRYITRGIPRNLELRVVWFGGFLMQMRLDFTSLWFVVAMALAVSEVHTGIPSGDWVLFMRLSFVAMHDTGHVI